MISFVFLVHIFLKDWFEDALVFPDFLFDRFKILEDWNEIKTFFKKRVSYDLIFKYFECFDPLEIDNIVKESC